MNGKEKETVVCWRCRKRLPEDEVFPSHGLSWTTERLYCRDCKKRLERIAMFGQLLLGALIALFFISIKYW